MILFGFLLSAQSIPSERNSAIEYEGRTCPNEICWPLHAYKSKKKLDSYLGNRLGRYEAVILITQGTFERSFKLIIPALEALKDQPYLLVVAAGFHHTEELRKSTRVIMSSSKILLTLI